MTETIVSKRTYLLVWGSLLILLGITVAVSYIHLGWFNPAAAVGIAVVKAVIIILFLQWKPGGLFSMRSRTID